MYGTARVRAPWRAAGLENDTRRCGAREWLAGVQNSDGGWGGDADTPSSVEETALAVEALLDGVSPENGGMWPDGLRAIRPKKCRKTVGWRHQLVNRCVETGTWPKKQPDRFLFREIMVF
ncbi:MAG: hypothetical protein Ct9H300mP1_19270 [Planctomycetaceae bacterium]|nr:MAG: hypothetical protein Ct9H300mP1_19270 [Planctomycetaceae bacterium]